MNHYERYSRYLDSAAWRFKRECKLDEARYRCQQCDRNDLPLEVHHKTYARLGHELLADLVVLCPYCHARRHGHIRDGDPRKHTYPEPARP